MYGQKLRQIRKNLNLSQEEMAFQTGITYRAYTSYERGDRKPSFEFLQKLVEKFNVNLNWLIANHGDVFSKPNKSMYNEIKQDILHDVNELLVKKGIV